MVENNQIVIIDFGLSTVESRLQQVMNTSAYSPHNDVFSGAV
jgi:tRNA A-37 threonylcarbamoyl transferase component Bud32